MTISQYEWVICYWFQWLNEDNILNSDDVFKVYNPNFNTCSLLPDSMYQLSSKYYASFILWLGKNSKAKNLIIIMTNLE